MRVKSKIFENKTHALFPKIITNYQQEIHRRIMVFQQTFPALMLIIIETKTLTTEGTESNEITEKKWKRNPLHP